MTIGKAAKRTLDRLRPGESGRIVAVDGAPSIARRLMELGLTPGAPLRLVRFAPLGDPLEIEVRGYFLTLRKNEAGHVSVE